MPHPTRADVSIKPLHSDPPTRRICALRLPTRHLTPATERFLSLLAEVSGRHARPL